MKKKFNPKIHSMILEMVPRVKEQIKRKRFIRLLKEGNAIRVNDKIIEKVAETPFGRILGYVDGTKIIARRR